MDWVLEPIGNTLRREDNGSDQNQIDPEIETETQVKIIDFEIGETSHEIQIVVETESRQS